MNPGVVKPANDVRLIDAGRGAHRFGVARSGIRLVSAAIAPGKTFVPSSVSDTPAGEKNIGVDLRIAITSPRSWCLATLSRTYRTAVDLAARSSRARRGRPASSDIGEG